jgi:GalNAc5-diNAcBac-PP-undecaprenol beta-1,3-glucosyltransferase
VSTAVTVLIPTFDNGESIARSIDSVLAQTVQNFELFVVGDGAVDVTRQLVSARANDDSRIRFFDNPKGPRHGEVHRHAALQHATGEIVAYLSDDDIWLPHHLEKLTALLTGVDFAHTSAVMVLPGDSLGRLLMDLNDPEDFAVARETRNRITPTMTGHTLDAYRRLPHGWRTAPSAIATDWWMWQQFFDQPGIRLASDPTVTALLFPNPYWRLAPAPDKLAAIERYWALTLDDTWLRDAMPVLQMDATENWLRRRERQYALLEEYTIRIKSALWFRALRRVAQPFRSVGAARAARRASRTTELSGREVTPGHR